MCVCVCVCVFVCLCGIEVGARKCGDGGCCKRGGVRWRGRVEMGFSFRHPLFFGKWKRIWKVSACTVVLRCVAYVSR